MVKLSLGELAPDFTLESTRGTIHLSDYRDKKNLVLCFYVMDNTPGCNTQLSNFKNDYSKFTDIDTEVLGINPASLKQHQEYSAKFGYPFPLLADEKREVCRTYGVTVPLLGIVTRTVMIIDKKGILRYNKKGMPSDESLLQEIEKI
jgi:peroxiredoxin Q/BCP